MSLENTLLVHEENQMLFEKNPQPMWVFDFNTLSFLAVNDAALETYGYSKDEFLSMTIKDIRPAEDVPALLEEISRGVRRDSQRAWRHKKKDGSIIDVEVLYNLIEFSGRDAWLVLVTDVTAHLKAEEELRFQKMLLEAQNEASIDGILVVSEEGRILSYNKRFVEIWQIPEPVIGTRSGTALNAALKKLANPEEFLKRVRYLYRQTCEVSRDEVQLKDGRTLDRYSTAIKDDGGEYCGRVWFFRDITEHKRAEKELRAAHERFNAFMNNSPAMSFMKDEEGRYVYVSRLVEKFYNKESRDLIGRTPFDLWPEDVAARVRENDLSVLSSGRVHEFFELLSDANGEARSCLSFKFPLKDSAGQTLLGGVAIDVTERQSTEKRLRESELHFRQLAENINEAFWIVDPNKREVLYVSPAYEGIWGRTCESLYQKPDSFLESVHPEDRKQVLAANERQRRGECCDGEYRIVRPDGSTRWIHDRAFPIIDEAGKVSRIVGIAEDVTERKRGEEQLRRLAAAVEQTADSIMITDTDGTIEYVNPAFERTTGYSEEEAIGKNPRLLKSGKVDKAVYESLWATITSGEVWVGNLINRKRDGTLFEERVTISPVRDNSGSIVNYIAVKQDITHQTQLEAQFRQAQKMESVGRSAGGVAHDFNNLLTAITGYSDLALRRLNQSDPLRKNLEEIRKAADRASGLTRQLLAFSRKQVMEKRVLDLNAILSDMNKMLPRLIGEDIKIDLSLDKELGKIKADPGQIEQVIVNLVVNARDAMPDGGVLTIKTSNTTMDGELVRSYESVQAGPHVLLSISDTGCGMDEETQQHIFEPFFTTKSMGKGTGLGLSTVFGIVKQSGGSIWVESKVGKGTTFKVYLPLVDGQADSLEALHGVKAVARGTETILLVEDDDLVRGMARATLEMCGYEVLDASNAGEALLISKERNCRIDLLLTDVVMPRMSGQTLVKEIYKVCPNIKVLYMSGYTDDVVAPRGINQEKADFIHKPFTPEALATRIRRALDSAL